MLKFFKIIALCEGISLLALLFIAMPFKYLLDNPEPVRIVGMAHGLLFVGYIIIAILLKIVDKWDWKKLGIVSLASVVPFGTFYVDRKYL